MSADLSTDYLGMELRSPFVASSCPLTGNLDMLRRLEDAGASAAVLPSLFEEQIEHEQKVLYWNQEFQDGGLADSLSSFASLYDYNTGPEGYLKHIELAKKTTTLPIIASLSGTTQGEWLKFAELVELSGADALELNIYFVPTDPTMTSHDVEDRYVDLVAAVRATVAIPLAVKLGPFFTALPHFAQRLVTAGADGLVLFNRYLEPDIDLQRLDVQPRLELSRRVEQRLPLRWIAILRDQLDISLAVTSGIHAVGDVTRSVLAGADVAMMASALLRHGPDYLRTVISEMEHWMNERNYPSVRQLKGILSRHRSPEPSMYERANYLKALTSFADQSNE